MHKYLPCIHIVKASNLLAIPWSPTAVFSFKETEFTAVTAYQVRHMIQIMWTENARIPPIHQNFSRHFIL